MRAKNRFGQELLSDKSVLVLKFIQQFGAISDRKMLPVQHLIFLLYTGRAASEDEARALFISGGSLVQRVRAPDRKTRCGGIDK